MATSSGFKQQCPSCEAWVPIKDDSLIGRKIDCPKCKYRFVVEEQAGDDDDKPKKKGKSGDAATSKKPVKGKRRDDDDEDRGKKGKKKQASGGGAKVALIIAVAVVALGALAVGGYFVFSGKGGDGGSSTAGTGGGSEGGGPPVAAGPDGGVGGVPVGMGDPMNPGDNEPEIAAAPPAPPDLVSNLLPNDTQEVLKTHLQDFVQKTFVGPLAFNNLGGLQKILFRQIYGVPLDDVEQMVMGRNYTRDWSFVVLHADKPINQDEVKRILRLTAPPEGPIQGQAYFVAGPNLRLSAMLSTRDLPAGANHAAAVHFKDAQTMVVASLLPMKEFLQGGGQPAFLTPPATAAATAPGEGGAADGGRGGPGGNPMGGALGPQSNTVPGDPDAVPGAKTGPGRADGGPGGAGGPGGPGGPPAGVAGPPGGLPGGPGMVPGGPGGQNQQAPAYSGSYLTVNRGLKDVLDRLDAKRPVAVLATDIKATNNKAMQLPLTKNVEKVLLQTDGVRVRGLGLNLADGVNLEAAYLYDSPDKALRELEAWQKTRNKDLTDEVKDGLGIEVEVATLQLAPEDGGGFGGGFGGEDFGGPGALPGGGFPGGDPDGRANRGGPGFPGSNAPVSDAPGGRIGFPGGPGGPGFPGAGFPGQGGFNMMGGQGGPAAATADPGKTRSILKNEITNRRVVVVSLDVALDDEARDKFSGLVRPRVRKVKGSMEMIDAKLQPHRMAEAARALIEAGGQQTPRGAFNRKPAKERWNRPYPPNERVSWMTDLLPYLGFGELATQVNKEKSWKDQENLNAATTLVQPFLDPMYPESSRWVKYPGVSDEVATTHFVGLAGVGLDAAEYRADDPANLTKLGAFGYDRQTKLSEVTDGLSNTILMIQVPATYKRPWLAGGGSTVQGVPETGSFKPFVATTSGGKRGTHALMIDGSVRFITEGISDDVFKTMVTVKAGDLATTINRDAPVVPKPEEPDAKEEPIPVTAAPEPTPPATAPPPAATKGGTSTPAKGAAPKAAAGTGGADKLLAVLNNNCGKCHTGAMAKGDVQIFTAPGKLNPNLPKQEMIDAIAANKMPPKRGGTPLSADDKTLLQTWLSAGSK